MKDYQICGIAKTDNVVYGLFMDQDKNVDTVLQQNLLRIIEERFNGNQAEFCRQLGFNPTYINAVVRGKKNLGKPNWEKIRNRLNLGLDLQTPVVQDKEEQRVLDWFREMRDVGMVREAEMMMEYLKNSAKKKEPVGGEGKAVGVPRRRLKRAG